MSEQPKLPKPRTPVRDYENLLQNYRHAWQALRMIREAIETLGRPGAMLSEDGVLLTYGPEPLHEGQAIVDALSKILNDPKPESEISFDLGYLLAELEG